MGHAVRLLGLGSLLERGFFGGRGIGSGGGCPHPRLLVLYHLRGRCIMSVLEDTLIIAHDATSASLISLSRRSIAVIIFAATGRLTHSSPGSRKRRDLGSAPTVAARERRNLARPASVRLRAGCTLA